MFLTSKRIGIAAVALVAVLLVGGPHLASAQQGKTLYTQKGCPACHGPDGNTPLAPNYPKLKGQNADYMVAQIKAFKSGERKGALSSLMAPMAATINDTESAEIAKWLQTGK
jgi:cytochrome c